MTTSLIAGTAVVDVTPDGSHFLFGYPHVPRYSTGVHDPLLSSALFLSDGTTPLLLVANDVISVNRQTADRVRKRIAQRTGIPTANMLITATHTHSGPLTDDMLTNETDPIALKTDPDYMEHLEKGIVESSVQAFSNQSPATLGFAVADGSCVGTNRHDPAGPSNPSVPVMIVRDADTLDYMAAMVVCSMHPTVLHEDSTLVSGDFPAMTREYLQKNVFGADCPLLYHTGPSGNQSPRHVTKANTFEEAKRLGCLLGKSIASVIETMNFTSDIKLDTAQAVLNLPVRTFPTVEEAQAEVDTAAGRLESLRQSQAGPPEVRTAECDWFGAEETLALARAEASGRLQTMVDMAMPVEIVLMQIGLWSFVGWPGEIFVEFSLAVKEKYPNCHVISLANGELRGYLVTEEAVQSRWYEATSSLFDCPRASMLMVEKTLELLGLH